MLQHQRDILAHMGIDIWLSRQHAQTRPHQQQFFRDQIIAPTEAQVHPVQYPADAATTQTIPQHDTPLLTQQQSVPQQAVTTTTHCAAQQKVAVTDADTTLIALDQTAQLGAKLSAATSLPSSLDSEAHPQLAPFELQLVQFKHAVLVIDSTNLSHAEQRLWRNIQALYSGQFHVLKWPLPLENLQEGRGAHYYVAGFLTAQSNQRRLIVLGHLAHAQDLSYQTAPSLKEMLTQPQRKAALWQLLSAAIAAETKIPETAV
ncbi:hypothetical protein [Acinetobacter larvae]|uniref:DNA polymerase III subunit psi n=1 Tax=Acinetobacter larvae TaxID=1789224 RepID=A0A1B2M0M9_9GAMM|nr:hypothetical protein [Acinetobacter larvae]AOA58721.1 hypothetical protein BFG52_10405 [Acinetobacter larvae]